MFLCKSRSSRCFSWCIFLVCRDCTGVLSGDKSSVTVLGHGTGAACLHYLMTSDALPHGKYNWLLTLTVTTKIHTALNFSLPLAF